MAEYPDEFAVTLPDPYLTAIGKVCVAWGHLEQIVDLAITKFAGYEMFDPRSAILTAHMTWPLKMDVLESLVDAFRGPKYPWLARFDDQVKPLLKRAQEGRNKVVHGQWGYEDGSAHRARATARGKLRATIDPITLADIDRIFHDIGRAGMALWKLVVNK